MYIGLAEPEDAVIIEGTRPLEMRIKGVHGDAATAAIVVNAIPRVLDAHPGLVAMTNLPIVSAPYAIARPPRHLHKLNRYHSGQRLKPRLRS